VTKADNEGYANVPTERKKGPTTMNLTDGAIMFIGCVLSFTIGYAIGAVRVTRYVNSRLDEIRNNMHHIELHSQEIRHIYSHLGKEENNEKEKKQ
jgi:hypothetical protein